MADVRPLRPEDRAAWQPLWEGYLAFYAEELDAETSDDVFARLSEECDGMFGLLATDGDTVIGLANVIVHPSTWTRGSYVYLEDLFVAPDARRAGAGLALMEAVYVRADEMKAARVYWHTQRSNHTARALYDRVGQRTPFALYERLGVATP